MRPSIKSVVGLLASTGSTHLVYLVHYGSRKSTSDVDLLAVYDRRPSRPDYVIGRLDLLALGSDQYRSLLQVHDPIASEPLLTGKLVYGDKAVWSELKSAFLATRPNKDTVFALAARCFSLIDSAAGYAQHFQSTRDERNALGFWRDTAFAIVYAGFVRLYIGGQFPVTYAEFLKHSPLLQDIVEHQKDCEAGKRRTSAKMMSRYVELARNSCLEALGRDVRTGK